MNSLIKTDILIAAVLCSVAAGWMLQSYSTVAALTRPANSVLAKIPRGKFVVSLTAGDTCFSRFDGELFERKGEYVVKGEGIVRVRIGDQEVAPRIESEFVFNSLGQLGGSVTRFRLGGEGLVLGTMNVSPLTIRLRGITDTTMAPVQFTVPGPVMLHSNGGDTFRIVHEGGAQLEAISSPLTTQPLFQALKLESHLEPASNPDRCPLDSVAPLDITSLSGAVQSFAGRFNFPGFSNE